LPLGVRALNFHALRNYRLNSGKSAVVLVALLTLAGLGLRFYKLSNQSLWTDEVASITATEVPPDRIFAESIVSNNALPAYSYLLRWVLAGARTNVEVRARCLSAVAGALSIPVFAGVVYLWERQRGAALVAGLLLAVNPLHLWYSQEARAYALMLFFGLLTLLFFELAIERRKAAWWAAYVASALTALAFHKTALIFPAACALWHGFKAMGARGQRRELLIHAPIFMAALFLITLKSYAGPKRPNSILEFGYTVMTFVGGYSFGPSLTAIQSRGPRVAVMQNLPQVACMIVVLLLVGVACARGSRVTLIRGTGLLVLAVLAVAAYAMGSGFSYNIRYALPALFGFLALASSAASGTEKPWTGRLALFGLLVVALLADVQWFCDPVYRKNDSRAVARWLVENKDQVKSWTALPGYLSKSIEWYLQPEPEVLARCLPAKDDRATSFPPVPDALIVGRRDHLVKPDDIIKSYEAASGGAHVNRSFAGIVVYERVADRIRD
jgi:mannosyltransferase